MRRLGLKVTLPRTKVLDLLGRSELHLGADDIHRLLLQEGNEVGLATVYRVLAQLEQAGLVRRSRVDATRAVFELEQGRHHDHLVCVRCGAVTDFHDPQMELRRAEVAERMGFDLVEHRLSLYGVCRACRERSATQAGELEKSDLQTRMTRNIIDT